MPILDKVLKLKYNVAMRTTWSDFMSYDCEFEQMLTSREAVQRFPRIGLMLDFIAIATGQGKYMKKRGPTAIMEIFSNKT